MLMPGAPCTALLGICSVWRQRGLGRDALADGSWLGHNKGLF